MILSFDGWVMQNKMTITNHMLRSDTQFKFLDYATLLLNVYYVYYNKYCNPSSIPANVERSQKLFSLWRHF